MLDVVMGHVDFIVAAEQIINLCEPIFAEDSTNEAADKAAFDIAVVLNKLVNGETEQLRGALGAMIEQHCHRFPLSGPCQCDACRLATFLVDGGN
jgi:hypothetical protein